MVNGNTWPFQTVEQRRYRFRFLNGCQSRFLILDFNQVPGVEVWAIGNEGGFLAAPVNLTADNRNRLLMALAERADLIVDFTNVPVGSYILRNVGPDEPFGGGEPGEADEPGDFDAADPETTGQVLQFRVVPAVAPDPTHAATLPAAAGSHAAATRGPDPTAGADREGRHRLRRRRQRGRGAGRGTPRHRRRQVSPMERLWMDPVTENPGVGDTEVWEIYNTTADAHPMHIHELAFEVVDRAGPAPRGRRRGGGRPAHPARRRPHAAPSPGRPGSRTRWSHCPAR